MYQLLIYACEDQFSHLPLKKAYDKAAMDLSSVMEKVSIYRAHFQAKGFSAMHLIVLDIQTSGAVSVVLNEYGENPVKTRTVINPEALEIKKAKQQTAKGEVTLSFPVAPEPFPG